MLHDYINCGGRMRNFKVRKCRNYIVVGPPEKERNTLETLQQRSSRRRVQSGILTLRATYFSLDWLLPFSSSGSKTSSVGIRIIA